MKKVVIISVALGMFALVLALVIALGGPYSRDGQAPPADPEPEESIDIQDLLPEGDFSDTDMPVRIQLGDEVVEMSMAEYLIGVVAAEMPASFEPEALKAQAVAARTDTLYHILVTPHIKHEHADMCGNFACCQAYQNNDELREKWGSDYKTYIRKVIDAVFGTDGVYMHYEGAPVLALFHSSSNGRTEAPENVWGGTVPYLVSVDSPETGSEVPNYVSTVTVSHADFTETVTTASPEAAFDGVPAGWVTDITHSESGRIATVTIGGVAFTGPQVRTMFGLRSTAATIEITDTAVIFTTTGYGHGVGMSQYGANTYAAQGKGYREILALYYTGVEISQETFGGDVQSF